MASPSESQPLPPARDFEVTRTARYFVLGEPDGKPAELWYVLHGYGQLASGFAGDFVSLASAQRIIVVPEGLSRHYRQGGNGEIGASWMTSEARDDEIADYVKYLDRLHAELNIQADRKAVFGFSQGAATAFRWASLGAVRFDRLVAWAGGLPPELDLGDALASTRCELIVGKRDRFFDTEQAEKARAVLAEKALSVKVRLFAGGHRLDRELLTEVLGSGG